MLLSEKLVSAASEDDKQVLLKKIIATSTQSWAYINLVGEYDFLDGKDYKAFDLDALKKLTLTPENWIYHTYGEDKTYAKVVTIFLLFFNLTQSRFNL